MVLLDQAREEAGVAFRVTSGARPPTRNVAAGGATDSAHLIDPSGIAKAVDGYFEGWPLLEQVVHLLRFSFFAVGCYPYPPPGRDPAQSWVPVVHVDRRDRGKPYQTKVLWVRTAEGTYVYWPSQEFRAEFRTLVRT